jgi:hypothetical protein
MLLPLLLALGAAPPAPAVPFDEAKTAARAQELLEKLAPLPNLRARVVEASGALLGTPYRFDPLGEGSGQSPDPDPRLRLDLVDCQTYLETVLALARARSVGDLLPTLDRIRYAGPVGYAERNHFFEAQWVPSAEEKGFVREITRELAGDKLVEHSKVVTPEQWDGRTEARRIALPASRAPVGRFESSYVPLDQVAALASSIPSGTLFAVVREDRPGTPYQVSHLGLIVRQGAKAYARHAGSAPINKVVDEELPRFVARSRKLGPWKVVGMRFFEPLPEPAASPAPKP